MKYTVIIITQVIEHDEKQKHRICSSEQSQLNYEHIFRAQDTENLIHKRVKELSSLPTIPPFMV